MRTPISSPKGFRGKQQKADQGPMGGNVRRQILFNRTRLITFKVDQR